MRRKGFRNIEVKEEVEFELSYYNSNNYGKLQFSGFINGDKNEYWYLPTHQQLVDELVKLPRGSYVRAKRLSKGSKKEPAKYNIEVIRKGAKPKKQKTLDSF